MLTKEIEKAIDNGDMIPVVYINCREHPFCDSILRGCKTFETRTRNTLGCLVGKKCLFVETGTGKHAKTRFYATIDSVIRIDSKEQFEQYRNECGIVPGSDYDWKPETKTKYLYHLTDITGEDEYEISFSKEHRHGRVWAEYWTA